MCEKKRNEDRGYDSCEQLMHTVSQTECTGLEPESPLTEAQAESYTQLYDIPYTEQKERKKGRVPSADSDSAANRPHPTQRS